MKKKHRIKMTTWQILALGYIFVIILGTGLLCLPIATTDGEKTTFLNALFTAVSATCVTGLVPYDTNTHWTLFGEIVLICLIQLGGLGFMTFVTIVFNLFGKNMGLSGSKLLMASAGQNQRNGIRRMFKRLLIGTLIFEGLGAGVLSIRFIQDFGALKGIYYAVWHSVSAFCNAGFDLMGGVFDGQTFASFTHYATDPIVSITIPCLILIGGLGFCVWDDILECKFNPKKFRLHTRVVLIMSAILIVIPTALFLFFEWNNPSYANYHFGKRLLIAFFNAVTPRTAGFNTVDMSQFTDSSYLLTLLLMFIGGSSGSTAGGVKLTTTFVIFMAILSVFRSNRDIEVGKRRVNDALVRQAFTIFVCCLTVILLSTICICAIERTNDNATLQAVLFETVSAMGTVGLSLGLTPTLSAASKIILILMMYAGRVGILTLGLAIGEKKSHAELRKPIGDLLIG